MFKNKIIFSFVLISLINPIICKSESIFTPFRLFFGLKEQATSIASSLSKTDRFGSEDDPDIDDGDGWIGYNYGYQRRIPVCFKRPSKGTSATKPPDVCRTKNGAEYGYEKHIEPASIDYASLEFVPNYFIWRIGYYIFLTQRKFNFTVVDYPTKNEELSGKLDANIFMVPFFITAGDKNLGKDGDFSFRFGVGPSITYLNEFYLENDKGSIEKSGILNIGEGGLITSTTVLFEITYNYLSIKTHFSEYRIKIEGDDYFKDDVLDFTTQDSSFGFYFYF